MRMIQWTSAAALPLVVASALAAAPIERPNCRVTKIEEARVPAQEQGVLTEVRVREGQRVAANDVLAMIDQKLAELECDVRKYELEVANKKAANQISVDYARSSAAVYAREYWRKIESNKEQPGTVPLAEIELTHLKYEESRLLIEKSQFELEIAALEVKVGEANLAAAKEHLDRRAIRAPWGGVVAEIGRHTGDWVNPGDPVLRLIRMDKLSVKCRLKVAEIAPGLVSRRTVDVVVNVAGGRVERFVGQVVGVSPEVDGNGEYAIWIDVANREQDGFYLLSDGMMATVSIAVD